MSKDTPEPNTDVIAETDNYIAWLAEEPDGETTYHLELNNVTLHFFKEEWGEFLELVRALNLKIRLLPGDFINIGCDPLAGWSQVF